MTKRQQLEDEIAKKEDAAFRRGERSGEAAVMRRVVDLLQARATEAMEALSRTPVGHDEGRRRVEWQLIERLRALHAVSRGESGDPVRELDPSRHTRA